MVNIETGQTSPYTKVTDIIFAVLIGLSFKEYHTLLMPIQLNYNVAVLIFIYVILIGSRITYENSILKKPYKDKKRFLVDIIILYLYYVAVFSIKLNQSYNTHILINVILFIFIGYLIWDIIKIQEYKKDSNKGIYVTIMCVLLSSLLCFYYYQPIFINNTIFAGATIREWYFLAGGYTLFIIFWSVKY